MNKKYILKNSEGLRFSCVLSPDRKEEEQWCEVFALSKGHGFSAERWGEVVRIRDYFAGEDRATFLIISEEETEAPVDCTLTKLDK